MEEAVNQANSFFPQALMTGLGNLSPDQLECIMNPGEDIRQEMIDRMKKLKVFAEQSIDNLQNKTLEEVKSTQKQIIENMPQPVSSREQQRDTWREQWRKTLSKRQQTNNQQQELLQQLQTALLDVVMQRCSSKYQQGDEPCQTQKQQKKEHVQTSVSMDGKDGQTTFQETTSSADNSVIAELDTMTEVRQQQLHQ